MYRPRSITASCPGAAPAALTPQGPPQHTRYNAAANAPAGPHRDGADPLGLRHKLGRQRLGLVGPEQRAVDPPRHARKRNASGDARADVAQGNLEEAAGARGGRVLRCPALHLRPGHPGCVRRRAWCLPQEGHAGGRAAAYGGEALQVVVVLLPACMPQRTFALCVALPAGAAQQTPADDPLPSLRNPNPKPSEPFSSA